MKMMRTIVFAMLAVASAASQACRVPPPKQLVPAEEQVRLATKVAVAQAIGVTPLSDYEAEYRFLVLEQLAGPAQKVVTVMGRAPGPYDKDGSFDHHRDFAFWARGGGRTMNGSDCVVHPSFVVGNSYLLFLDTPATWRSFEQIDMVDGRADPEDQWLAYARQRLAGTAPLHDTAPAYERIGRFLYGFQRLVARDQLDRQALAAQQAPAELLYRAGRLADAYDRIVQAGAQVADAEIDATLREAGAVQAALQAWRAGGKH